MALHPHDSPDLRKARGAFFTPEAVARYVTEWAIRKPSDRVLEPSCGEAVFLLEAGARLAELGAPTGLRGHLHGAELHAHSADMARHLLPAAGHEAKIAVGDFLRRRAGGGIRRRDWQPALCPLPGLRRRVASRGSARRAPGGRNTYKSCEQLGRLHRALSPPRTRGGRLGLVLPAEILTVNYAAPVREFLMKAFGRVRLVLFTERVFPGVMEDVVLLMAEGRGEGPTDHCELLQTSNGETLGVLAESDVRRWSPRRWGPLVRCPSPSRSGRRVCRRHPVPGLRPAL